MAADETLQSPVQQTIVMILGVQPYVLYQTRVYNMASQQPSVQGYSLLSLFDMCLLLLPLEDSLLCTILIYATAHSATTTKTARLTERRRNYETHISAAGHVLVLYSLCFGLEYIGELSSSLSSVM